MRGRVFATIASLGSICALAVANVSCRTPPLPAFETSSAGWEVQTGQAVWTPAAQAEAVAGDFLLATHPDGRLLIDFSKGSLSVVVVRCAPQGWRLEAPAQAKTFGGRGLPPPRSGWLVLARDRAGHPPPKDWEFTVDESGATRMRSLRTGESLELYLSVP